MPHSFERPSIAPQARVTLGLPVGSVIAFAGEIGSPALGTSNIESQGWMICDGQQLNVTDYPELFAVLGFRYVLAGEPDQLQPSDSDQDSNHEPAKFRIPDLQGYFLRGVDTGTGTDPDANTRTLANGEQSDAVGSLQQSALMDHTHAYSQATTATAEPAENTAGAQSPSKAQTAGPTLQNGLSVSKTENRPVNMYVYFIIRYTNGGHLIGAPLPSLPLP